MGFQDLLEATNVDKGVDLTVFTKIWYGLEQNMTSHFYGELRQDFQNRKDVILKAFRDFDVDHDGYITKDEFLKVCKNLID